MFKKDFPIFQNNPWLIYLDNAATTQKPKMVIDWVKNYLENDYANIHRWMYELSERSEELYFVSKEIVAKNIWWKHDEIIYTYNSTYAFNILVQSLVKSKKLQKWDKVLLSISEHHANVVPWFLAQENIWIDVDFVNITSDYQIDFEDFTKKYDESVKIVSFTHVSNVSGSIFDLEKLWNMLRDDTIFIVDASQSVPNFSVDINKIWCDYLIFTWHKIMAQTGIWVLWWKKSLLKDLYPSIWWGWSISHVKKSWFDLAQVPECFEPGTPNLVWAVSLLKAFEYIDSIWWYQVMQQAESKLVDHALSRFNDFSQKIELVWPKIWQNRIWVFSFVIKDWISANELWQKLAFKNICVRVWWHCAHPFLETLWYKWTVRMSLYFYNDISDIDIFFEELKKIL